jgi:hypothetical protein
MNVWRSVIKWQEGEDSNHRGTACSVPPAAHVPKTRPNNCRTHSTAPPLHAHATLRCTAHRRSDRRATPPAPVWCWPAPMQAAPKPHNIRPINIATHQNTNNLLLSTQHNTAHLTYLQIVAELQKCRDRWECVGAKGAGDSQRQQRRGRHVIVGHHFARSCDHRRHISYNTWAQSHKTLRFVIDWRELNVPAKSASNPCSIESISTNSLCTPVNPTNVSHSAW